MERNERAAQQEGDLQRWADDGGAPPMGRPRAVLTVAQPHWGAVGVALAVGFAVGWLTGE